MNTLIKKSLAAGLALAGFVSAPANAALTLINDASTFANAVTEDFSSRMLGPVDATTVLANLGITNVATTINATTVDAYDASSIDTPALLAGTDGQLRLADFGESVATTSFTFSFGSVQDRILFDVGDQVVVANGYVVETFLNGVLVDTLTLTLNNNGTTDVGVFGIVADAVFDTIGIRALSTSAFAAFGIDALTVDLSAAPVPLPGAMILFGAGAAAFGAARRRKASA